MVERKMTILVTGSGGFVGNHAANAFHDTVSIERDTGKRHIPGAVAVGDLRDRAFVDRVVLEYSPDVVLHFAASAIVNQGVLNPAEMYSSNVMGTLNLLEACKKLGKKDLFFLYFGTDKALGDSAGATEDAPYPWEKLGPYEQSKAMAEVLAMRYEPFFRVCRTRSGNIYGPGDRSDRLIPNDIRLALAGKNPLAYNEDRRQYVYVDDVVAAVKLLVEKRAGGCWHIGSPAVKTTVEVAGEIAGNFLYLTVERATDQVQAADKYLHYIHNQWLDFSKLEGLGWSSKMGFSVGIRKTIDWWRGEG